MKVTDVYGITSKDPFPITVVANYSKIRKKLLAMLSVHCIDYTVSIVAYIESKLK